VVRPEDRLGVVKAYARLVAELPPNPALLGEYASAVAKMRSALLDLVRDIRESLEAGGRGEFCGFTPGDWYELHRIWELLERGV